MAQDRKNEHEKFISWLLGIMTEKKIDALIIAGDIFDTGTPPNYAQAMYYKFLSQVRETGCGQVIIVGGNHDSVSTLHAPKSLLKIFNVDVIGGISSNLTANFIKNSNNLDAIPKNNTLSDTVPCEDYYANEIIVVKNQAEEIKGIVGAVPFLRERDIRKSVAGESYADKSMALVEGIKNHYKKIARQACIIQKKLSKNSLLPMVVTGHLFTSGSKSSDGVRDIYVGSLGQIGIDTFPDIFDYVALGHLHRSQSVGGCEHIRYSGSPIPLSFSESDNEKQVVLVDIEENGAVPQIQTIKIPEFQKLYVVKGDFETIEKGLKNIDLPDTWENNGEKNEKKVWLEIQYKGKQWKSDLNHRVKQLIVDKPIELFAVQNLGEGRLKRLNSDDEMELLTDLKVEDVFEKRLETAKVSQEDREEFRNAFNEIINQINTSKEVSVHKHLIFA